MDGRSFPWRAIAGALVLVVTAGCSNAATSTGSAASSSAVMVKGDAPVPGSPTETPTSTATPATTGSATSTPAQTLTAIPSSTQSSTAATAATPAPSRPSPTSSPTSSLSPSPTSSPTSSLSPSSTLSPPPSLLTKTPLPSISIIKVLPTLKVTTPTPRVPTCAQGGTCRVGERGPGGGTVIFAGRGQFICGPQRNRVCTTIEAAPIGWNGTREDAFKPWCPKRGDRYGNVFTNDGLGWGMANTANIVAVCGTDSAAGLAANYRGGGLSDWYLPAKAEVDELYRQRSMIGSPLLAYCWSSSQVGFDTGGAWLLNFRTNQWEIALMDFPHSCVRPIRAF